MTDGSRWQLLGMALLLPVAGLQLVGEGVTPWLLASAIAVGSAVATLSWRWRLRDAWRATAVGESISAGLSTAGPVVMGLLFVGGLWLSFSYTVAFSTLATGLLASHFVDLGAEWVDLQTRVRTVGA
jgi:hypothetical protein